MTSAGWPTTRATMRRTTAVGPAWCRPPSPAASSRSPRTPAASANAGTETPTTSRAVAAGRGRCRRSARNRPEKAQATETVYNRSVATGVHIRSHAQILRFFDGFELLDPGLVYIPH